LITSTITPSSNNTDLLITPEISINTKTTTSFEPLLITPSKVTCSCPLLVASPKQNKKHSLSKFELKVKINGYNKRLGSKILQ